jgi:hypothetical protein
MKKHFASSFTALISSLAQKKDGPAGLCSEYCPLSFFFPVRY